MLSTRTDEETTKTASVSSKERKVKLEIKDMTKKYANLSQYPREEP